MSLVETVEKVKEDLPLLNLNKNSCKYVNQCERYKANDWFCNHTNGRHGVDLTKTCYKDRIPLKE